MNSSYKLVYSEALNTWVAVGEHVSARGKKSAMRLITAAAMLAGAAVTSGWAIGAPPLVNQLPTGGQVAAGAVAISQTQSANAASMAITQSSQQAIVNWQSFNVGANAKVNITQPGSSSVLLNRVMDTNPSQIFGQINANGQVFLTNPNGVYFAPGSSVDVGSFTATSHGISDTDFLSGNYNFSRNGATGSVINQGSLTAGLGGYIALLAPEVQNQGVVLAQMGGTVALAAGESFKLQFNANNQLTNVLVTPATIQTLVNNGNAVQAPGGLIILSAQAANGLLGGVVKNTGVLSATGLVSEGGVIRLSASHRIELAQTSSIAADAAPGSAGKGGRIEVIADLSNSSSLTQVDGTLSAKGGDLGGDGGFVETSGARLAIGDNTLVSTGAPKGRSGTWLLDPYDVTIVDSATESGTVYADDLTADATTVILTSSINNSLAANTNVTISTGLSTDGSAANYSENITGNIYLNGNISWNTAATLTLTANKDIFVGSAAKTGTITVAGTGTLTLNPGTLHYWNTDSTQYIDTGGRILMGMAATPTAGLSTGYWNGTAFTTGAATGFNGQVNVSPAATLNINDVPYSVIHSQAAFEAINNTGNGYVVGSHLDFAGKTYTGSPVRAITKNFNGLGHQISNLTISQSGDKTAGIGLFSEIGEYYSNRNFSNLGLTGSVSTTTAGEVGSLAGVMSFTRVSNVYSTASVTATLNAGGYYGYGDVGGLIGQVANWGSYGLSNAYATGKVTVNTNTAIAVGGLVGQNAPGGHMGVNIDHSYATGDVEVNVSSGSVSVGGLVGSYSGSGGELNYNHATGNVTVTGGSHNSVGGLVGSATSAGGPYTFNYATGDVTNSGSGNSSTGGLIGYLQISSISNSFATGAVTSSIDSGSTGGLVGYFRTGGSPSLSNSYTSGSVTGPALSNFSGSGGLVGRIGNWEGPLTLTSNYYDSTKNGSMTGVGGIGSETYVALPDATNQVTALSTTAMRSASSFSSGFGNTGGAFTAASGWGYGDGSINSGLPVLCALASCVSYASGISATTVYLLPVSGQSSVYGSAPSINYLFYASSDGTGTSYSASTLGATGTLNYSITKGGSTYSGNTLTSSDGAGTYGLTYSNGVTLGNSSYVLATSGYSTPINYTISKAQLTVTPNHQTRYYGDPNPTFSQTLTGFVLGETSSTAGITGSGLGSSAATVSTGVGTATILGDTGTYAASNYDFTAANGTLTINPRPITVTATDQSRTYGSANPTSGSVTLTSGSLANSDALGAASVVAQATATATANAGTTHTLTPSEQIFSAGSADNYAISYASGTLSITQAPLSVTANSTSKTYGDTKTFAGIEFSSSGLVNGETIGSMTLFSTGMGPSAGVIASPYTINPSAATGGTFSASNYAITYNDGVLTVNPRPITVTAIDQSRAYGSANPTSGGVTLTSGSLANSDALGAASVVAQATATSTANAGTTHTLTPSEQIFSAGSADNYAISYASGTLSITQAPLSVTANSTSKTYGDTKTFAGTEFSSSGLVNGETIGSMTLFSTGMGPSAGVSASPYTINPSAATGGTFSASNYAITYNDGVLTVNPRPITVTANDQSRTYGSANPTSGSVTLSSGSLANSDTLGAASVVAQDTATSTANAGTTHTLTPSEQIFSAGSADNYAISYASGTLTVNQRPITVTANDQSRTYGSANPTSGSVTLTSGSLVNSDALGTASVAAHSTATSTANAGTTHTLTPSEQIFSAGSADNYAISYASGTLTVNQRPITVTAIDQSRTYGSANPTSGGVTLSSGSLANSDTLGTASVAAQNTATSTANAGTVHTLTPSAQTFSAGSASNYAISYANGRLFVGLAQLTVTANNTSKTYDAQAYSGGAGVTYSGFISGDSASVLYGDLSYSGSSQGAVNAGNYTLMPGGLSSSNYFLSFVPGSMLINKAALTATGNSASVTYNGANQTVSGFTVSGLQGSDSVTDLRTVTAAGATGKNVGSYTNAVSAGTETNYTVSTVAGSLGIAKASATVTASSGTLTYNGANQTVSGFTASGLVGSDTTDVLTGVSATRTEKNAGTYATTASGSSGNYFLNFVPGLMLINKAALTATGNSASVTYNGEAYRGGNGVTYSGFVSNETAGVLSGTLAYSGTSQGAKNAGNYSITPTGLSSVNYNISYVDGLLTIRPAPLTVSVLDVTKSFDGTTSANASPVVLSGQLFGKDALKGGKFQFDNAAPGSHKTVAVSEVSFSEELSAGNYLLTLAPNTNSTILAAPVVTPLPASPPVSAASVTAPGPATSTASVQGSSTAAASSGATSPASSSASSASQASPASDGSGSSSASQGSASSSASSSSSGSVSASGGSSGGATDSASAAGGSASGSAASGSSAAASGASSNSSSSGSSSSGASSSGASSSGASSSGASSSSASSSGASSSGASSSSASRSGSSASVNGARSGDKSVKTGSQGQKSSESGRTGKSTLANQNGSAAKSSKTTDAVAASGKGAPVKQGATASLGVQSRSRIQANGAEKGSNLPKTGSGNGSSSATPSLAARAASMAATRQAKGMTPQPNGASKVASAAAPKVQSLASRAAALPVSRQVRLGSGNAPSIPPASLSARAESLGISGVNKGMGNISADLMAQAALRYRVQASLPELTEAKKAEGNSAAMQAISALDAITVSVCETGCTKEQSNSVLAVQIQMQTSGNPLAAPADTRRDSFHHMPWKNNSGLMNSGRSRTVADFTENLEDVNLMGTLNLFIIP